jgi:cell division protease FtsH
MIDRIVLSLGGRVAEAIVLDDISTGASNDIQQATNIARNMVTRYGMSKKLGTVLYGSEHSADEVFLGRDFSSGQNYSEKTAAEIDDEIRSIINAAYETCEKILTDNIAKLHFVAEFLLKNEFMDEDQFRACMEAENPTIEEIEAIATERARVSEEENKTAHENNEKAREEAQRLEDEAKKAATGGDFFDSFWRDMQGNSSTPSKTSEEVVKEEPKNEDSSDENEENK